MKVFYDCEFVERGRELPIQLVSIGLVREDGQELYRINPECLSNVFRHPWLVMNVVPYLPIAQEGPGILSWDEKHEEYSYVARSLDELVADVLAFLQGTPDLELWAYYSAYDHVVLCQLFGSMADLPAGVPMLTRDVQELVIRNPGVSLPPEGWKIHHAMDDARWARDAYWTLATNERRELFSKSIVDDAEIIDESSS